MDNKTRKKIDNLIEKTFSYWDDLRCKYGFGDVSIPITFFPYAYLLQLKPNEIANIYTENSMCKTIVKGKFDKENNLSYLEYHVYWSYEDLYMLLIECDLDYDKTFESIKFALNHEMGHIITYLKLLGKSRDDWNIYTTECNQELHQIPKLRRNASYEKRLQWYLLYHSAKGEKDANEAVGITEQDIINDYRRSHRK